jgi:hypothetical protein
MLTVNIAVSSRKYRGETAFLLVNAYYNAHFFLFLPHLTLDEAGIIHMVVNVARQEEGFRGAFWMYLRRCNRDDLFPRSEMKRRRFAGIRVSCVALMVNTSCLGTRRIERLLPRLGSRTTSPVPLGLL